ncbi:Pilin (type 1 fimbria component protein) [Pseudomonas simiae]|uniref:fimbrial protein n=1 Tax=Pseudomonas simiae TaxID=321846 RepID=UPI00084DF7FC|nr:fimbrial protein [Pseudomonas simiae]SFB39451.1 Pilin (type 1 fimbria component protein) [Pseudomonas simiae]
MIRSSALVLTFCTLGAPVFAADVLKGRVQLTGSIVDSACTIRMGNDNQTVAFNPLSLNSLTSGNSSARQSLNIYISDCVTSATPHDIAPLQHFKLTFEGPSDGKNFAIHGAAKGIALRMEDDHGKLISPGMSIEHSTDNADSLLLNYSLTLVGSGDSLETGDYHATIKLSIQHF